MPERKETYPKDKVSEYIYSSYVLKGGRGGRGWRYSSNAPVRNTVMPDKKQARKVPNWYARVGGMPWCAPY